jgi:hypothetical protein
MNNKNTGRTTRRIVTAIAQILAEGSGTTLVQDHYENNNTWFMNEFRRQVHSLGLLGFEFKVTVDGVLVTYIDPFGRR